MKIKRILGHAILSLTFVCGLANVGRTEASTPAALQVTILDENGSLVHSAHVYIFSRNKKKFFGTREAYGISTFDLPSGDYRIYAGFTVKTDGIVDHYSSPEACIHVSASEPTSIILSLQKAEDPEMVLSDT